MGLIGFAGGLVLPGLRRAATVLDPENVGENLGRLIVGEIGGFVLGPIAASLLVEVGGLRAPFIAFAVPGDPGCVVVSRGLLDRLEPRERKVVFAHERAHLRLGHHRYLHASEVAAAS